MKVRLAWKILAHSERYSEGCIAAANRRLDRQPSHKRQMKFFGSLVKEVGVVNMGKQLGATDAEIFDKMMRTDKRHWNPSPGTLAKFFAEEK